MFHQRLSFCCPSWEKKYILSCAPSDLENSSRWSTKVLIVQFFTTAVWYSQPWCWISSHQKLIPSCLLLSPTPMWKQQSCTTAAVIAVLKMNQHARLQYAYLVAESSKQLNNKKKALIRKHSHQVISNPFKQTPFNVQTSTIMPTCYFNCALNK